MYDVFRLVRSLTGGKEEAKEPLRWSRLHDQISQKLTTLKKVQEENQTLISSDDGGTGEKVGRYIKLIRLFLISFEEILCVNSGLRLWLAGPVVKW